MKKIDRIIGKLSKVDLEKAGLNEIDPLKELTDLRETMIAIEECLSNKDFEGAREMLAIYANAVRKLERS